MDNQHIQDIKSLISINTWNVIKDNYERKSYTTAITNLLQFINEVIQDKANLEQVDNTSLIEQAFFGKRLCINKLQTRTEKDIQEGIGHILKGACLAIRNPRSHTRINDDQLTADRIIVFYDYILSFILSSEAPNLVDDWLDFIFDRDFVSTKEYAEETFNRIPKKKRYDLLVSIFRARENAHSNNLKHIVDKLLNSISEDEFIEFIGGINKELIKCNNNYSLQMFLNLFPVLKWDNIDNLAKLRVEHIVLKSIENAYFVYEEDTFGNCVDYEISSESMLAVYALDFIPHFSNVDSIRETINKICRNDKALFNDYYCKYFSKYMDDESHLDSFEDMIETDDNLPF